MDDMELKAPGLFVAGHVRDGISLGDSILSAHKAAGKIQAFLPAGLQRPEAVNHPVSA
jgi:heterodisulfide reductase subunit A-like polyferredoxin